MEADLEGRRVLLTGATGFIGTRVHERLLAAGAEVHAVSRQPRQSADSTVWWEIDLADAEGVERLFLDVAPDTVIHLASEVHGGSQLDLMVPTLRSNIESTVNLLVAATEARCRRVVLSGSMVEPQPGDADQAPSSPYALTKWVASRYAAMFHELHDLPVVNLRVFLVYGPGQEGRKLLPHVIDSLLRGEAPALSSGQWRPDWVYVDDVADACVAAALAEGVDGETFDIGSGETATLREVVEGAAALVDGPAAPRFGALPDRPPEPSRVADVERTATALGWRPRTGLAEGLRLTVDWHRQAIRSLRDEGERSVGSWVGWGMLFADQLGGF